MHTEKVNIKSYSRKDLQHVVAELGEPGYRANQIHRWLFNEQVENFESMTNLGAKLRNRLSNRYAIQSCSIAKKQLDPEKKNGMGTSKFLVKLHDEQTVETVLIQAEDRNTVCVSSQVGCPLRCTFCATGYMGFTRNLNAAEMAEQVYLVNNLLTATSISNHVTNVVFMGMGEPLLNTSNVIEAIETLSDQDYSFSLPQRKITISTVGLIPQIDAIARSGIKTKLAVSLHTANQQKRASLMPVAKEHTLDGLHNALERYVDLTGKPVTLVYMLLEGINDTIEDAKSLVAFCSGFLCKINLIDYNSIVNMKFKPVETEWRDRFIRILVGAGLNVTVRKSYGTSINAACGQLALKEKTLPADRFIK
ncbi:23S rRNA (adenine(2503)-C(2))-methyltransferase RlmN [Prosthecochloris sp. SCSIO W1103]|uniref:23S rRNA (adenine(2503)-C(2))-methyltransferase RlmN n=1 Tax=Prosthecochloris sp. SCSIO W1103 TaxID=2992244 RepID=UPI00223D33D4|nr:23S rRNA (adenine(2503)-C(2))-methyltransferase RlmN [Prosthecochloris sp. SCSIO W1103]UZJ38788.1 23S rRNA (adenine(2503)-C(2))-methyltransferase RlmN [Prosthecochloris sp. SCSIO W1103]